MPLSELQERARQRWCLVQAAVWLPLLCLLAWRLGVAHGLPNIGPNNSPADGLWMWSPFVLLLLSFITLWLHLGAGRHLADWVTLARFLGLVTFSFVVLMSGRVDWITWTVALFVVLADLLDGFVARKYGGSEAGAVLDMETDQFTTLVLSTTAYALTSAGVWTLALPAFKYVFVLAMTALGLKSTETKPCEGDNRRARLICAFVLSLLLASIFPPFPPIVRMLSSGLAVLLLVYSFSSDAAFLWRHARSASAPN